MLVTAGIKRIVIGGWLLALTAVGATTAHGQNFKVERVASGLDSPTYLTQAPGDNNTLYITELGGAIKKLDVSTGVVSTFATLDASSVFAGGLHTIAFHPDFQNNGKFYASHLVDAYGSFTNPVNRVDEYTVDGFGTVSLARNLLEAEHSSSGNGSHSIDWIGFDPTAPASQTLYATIGDGFTNASQPITSPFGKVLTFDTSQASPAWQALHTGLRNPWKASFDQATGDLYIGDVGLNAREEIDFAKAGATGLDFGWAIREGTAAGPEANDPSRTTTDPIYETFHADGNASITGGYVYRGPVSELQGEYFFADFVSQRIWSGQFDRDTDPNTFNGNNLTGVTERKAELDALIPGGGSLDFIVSFGEDNAGNLYLVDYGDGYVPTAGSGEIFMITSVPEPGAGVLLLTALFVIASRRRIWRLR